VNRGKKVGPELLEAPTLLLVIQEPQKERRLINSNCPLHNWCSPASVRFIDGNTDFF
jgi:hypothetical protein